MSSAWRLGFTTNCCVLNTSSNKNKLSHLSSWISATAVSVKTCRGNRWWKDRARWGANTRVKPFRQHATQTWVRARDSVVNAEFFGRNKKCNGTSWPDLPHTLHSTGNSVYLPRHCGQKYPPRDKPGPPLPSSWLGDTHTVAEWGKPTLLQSPAAHTQPSLLLTPYWTKVWCPGPSQRRCCAGGSLRADTQIKMGLSSHWENAVCFVRAELQTMFVVLAKCYIK